LIQLEHILDERRRPDGCFEIQQGQEDDPRDSYASVSETASEARITRV
jgi:hypothetical protein